MIGGDVPYDPESGGPADAPQHSSPSPLSPQTSQQQPQSSQMGEPVVARAEPPPSPEPTGDERVDAALSRLDELLTAPVADHVEVFEDVHRRLQDVLASVDHEEQPPAPGEPSDAAARQRPGPRPAQHSGPRPGPPNWGS